MSRLYRVHEFAELAGVTVRALHLYDRMGLLKPQKSSTRYRLYTEKDLERLEQIVALKFLGLSLKQIKAVLQQHEALGLEDALRFQREVLEEKGRLLRRAIDAIDEAERTIQSGQAAGAGILRKIIEVIKMQETIEFMRPYFGDAAWAKWSHGRESWPSDPWIALMRDVQRALGEDPAGPVAQELAARWGELRRAESGNDPELYLGLANAWIDRSHWPAAVQRRVDGLDLSAISAFVSKAAMQYRKRYYSDEAWRALQERVTPETQEQTAFAWLQVYHDVDCALDEDPAGEKAQALVKRWFALARATTGSDPSVRAGSMKAWADRKNWPAAASELRTLFNTEKIAAFIRAATDAHMRQYYSDEAWAKRLERSTAETRQKDGLAWIELIGEVQHALGESPGSERVQALAERWLDLSEQMAQGDAGVRMGQTKAWADRENWPTRQPDDASFSMEPVHALIQEALRWPMRKYFSDEAWEKLQQHRAQITPQAAAEQLQARIALFRALADLVPEDPASEQAQELTAQWLALGRIETGGDAAIAEAMKKCWEDRAHWTPLRRKSICLGLQMDFATIDRVADLIGKAIDHRMRLDGNSQ